MATPKILIIYTGGTIGMGKDPVTGVLEPLDFNHLVSSMPEFKLIQAEIDVRKFDPPIDSSDMDPMRWAEIVSMISNNYNDYDGFVILHGTDTMAYTSSALSFMLENLTKPVILTGSQLPIGELRTDGKENLMTAIEIASAKNENGTPDGAGGMHLLQRQADSRQPCHQDQCRGIPCFRIVQLPSPLRCGHQFPVSRAPHSYSGLQTSRWFPI